MALLPGLTLDDATTGALDRLIAQIPDRAVKDYAHASPAFAAGGFRTGRVPAIRARIRQMVQAAEPIDEALRRLLAGHSLNAAVVAPLSVTFLNDHREALSRLFGAADMRVARLLDERDAVREAEGNRAFGAVADAAADGEAERAAMREGAHVLRGRLSRLMEAVAAHADEAGGEGVVPPRGGDAASEAVQARLREKLARAHAELHTLKSAESRIRNLREKLAACEADVKRTREKLEAEQAACRGERQRAARAEAELKRNLEQAERLVDSRVEARLALEFRGWLGGPRQAVAAAAGQEGEADTDQPDALLRQAAAALEVQARADRSSGTRATLRQREARLEAMLGRCRDALANAMHPQPALLEAAEALCAEIERLRRLLQAGAADPLVPVLTAAVNTAPSGTVDSWKTVLEGLRRAGSLDTASLESLRDALRRRHAMLDQMALAAAPEAKPDELASPRGRLRAMLAGQLAGVLLIDGHNALFALQARYRRPQDHVYPDARARDGFVGDIVRMTRNKPTCRVRIVFDGPERNEQAAAENVGVAYSGGAGEHRADGVLLEDARYFRQTPLDAVLLATNDNELAAAAARLGAGILPPTDLFIFCVQGA